MLERLKKILYRGMTNNEIDYKTAKQMINENPATILLDVRSKQEYEEGHLPCSQFLCLYDIKKEAKKILPNTNETIIVYCSSGNRSKEAQKILESMGYKHVYNLKKGLDGIDN